MFYADERRHAVILLDPAAANYVLNNRRSQVGTYFWLGSSKFNTINGE